MLRPFTLVLLCAHLAAPAQVPDLEFAFLPVGPYGSEGAAVTTDADGNSYSTGFFLGSADLDPGPDTLKVTAKGQRDAYVTKVDAGGQLVWARFFGGTNNEYPTAIDVDAAGNVYIIGWSDGSTELDPGPAVWEAPYGGSADLFINKLDAQGTFVWGRGIGGPGYDAAYGLAHDGDGNIYVGGMFSGSVDFGRTNGPVQLTTAGSEGRADGFILRSTGSGEVQWVKAIGGSADDFVKDLALDSEGGIVFTGGFVSNDADFDPRPDVQALLGTHGLTDAYVAKWDAGGNYAWAVQVGGTEEDGGLAIAVDAQGGIHSTGLFNGTCDLDPAGEGQPVTSAGGTDIFICAYAPDGALSWARSLGGDGADEVKDIACAADGHVWLAGSFASAVDMDPGEGEELCAAYGPSDLFLLVLDAEGRYASDITMGGPHSDQAEGLHAADGRLYATGRFQDHVDFDANEGSTDLTAAENASSAFTLALSSCVPTRSKFTDTGCWAYVWNGVTFWESGTYEQHFTNAHGCDSLATLLLTVAGIDTTVIEEGPTLTALQEGAMYQWVDCTTSGTPLGGATDRSFTPETEGLYAVVVTIGGCSMTSGCHLVLSTAIAEHAATMELEVVPNPARDRVSLRGGGTLGEVVLYDAQGKAVRSWTASGPTLRMDLPGCAPGLYVVRAVQGARVRTARMVVE